MILGKQILFGGASGMLPEIIVTAPSGSTIDIMQNSIVLQSYTLGQSETTHTFQITALGTYDVRGTQSGITKTETVLIDAVAQYRVEIILIPNYTLLYYLGDECEDVTGGWESKAVGNTNPTMTKNSDNLSIVRSTSSQGGGWFLTKNTISSSEYCGFFAKMYLTINASYTDAYLYASTSNTLSSNYYPNNSIMSASAGAGSSSVVSVTKNGFFASSRDSAIGTNVYYSFGIRNGGNSGNSYSSNIKCFALVKEDDISGLSAYGADIATILTNSASMLSNETAVRYMVSKCTGRFMASALCNSTFLSAYNSSSYKALIDSNIHWHKFLSLL